VNQLTLVRLCAGRLIAALADQFLLFAVPLIVYQITGSIAKSGIVFCVEWLPRVLVLPIAGVFADRFGGRTLYLLTDGLRASVCTIAFLLLGSFPGSTVVVLGGMVGILGLLSAQSFIALEASLPRYLEARLLPMAQSLIQGSEQSSQIVGPVLAALVASIADKQLLLVVAGLGFGFSFLNVLLMGERLDAPRHLEDRQTKPLTLLPGLRLGWSVLRTTRGVLSLIGLTMLVNGMVGVTLASSAAITTATFHKPDSYFGVLYTIGGGVGVASFVALPHLLKRISLELLALVAYGCMCLGAVMTGVASTYAVFAVGLGALLGTVGIFNVFIRTERARRIPAAHLGKCVGLIVFLNQLSLPLSGLAVALVAGRLGPQTLIWISGMCALIGGVVLLPNVSPTRLRMLVATPRSR
jgi:MFS family permease